MDGVTFLLVCLLGAFVVGAFYTLVDGVSDWWHVRHP
jgi:hypothetical protein